MIRIGRLRATCLVPDSSPGNAALADRVSLGLRNHLRASLSSGLSRWVDRSDESVWVIRRLDCSVVVGADAAPDVFGTAAANSLGHTLAKALTGDGDGTNAIRFPNRAAYLRQFVVDMAAGHAWSRWYYTPFAGLKQLTDSAAVRTTLIEDAACGRAVLTGLDDDALANVCAALEPGDEAVVIDSLARSASDPDLISDVLSAPRNGYARATKNGIERGRVLFTLIRAVVNQRDRLPTTKTSEDQPFEGITNATPAAAVPRAGRVVRSVHSTDAVQGSSSLVTTRFGGLLLLLPDLDERSWETWTATWPPPPIGSASAVLKWLTLALCSGPDRVRPVLGDETLRALLGVASDATMDDVGHWLRQVGRVARQRLANEARPFLDESIAFPRSLGIGAAWGATLGALARSVLDDFAHRLPGFAQSTPDYLWSNFLAFDATVETENDRIVVRCGRPPLHLVLSLTGMTRGLTAGHDAQGRPILLFPRE